MQTDITRLDVHDQPREDMFAQVRAAISSLGYSVVEVDEGRPWGAFYRFDGSEAERFVGQFFPGVSMNEARLGNDEAELSPKLLVVAPGQRLSWQYHDRRAERWHFLTDGAYHKSLSDEPGQVISAQAGTIVQFEKGERHRLCAGSGAYTIVAEIWQHTDSNQPSDESDIVRLADDYKR